MVETTLRIGKNGLTPGIIAEARSQLRAHHTIKVRMLRPALETHGKDATLEALARETGARIVKRIGHIAVLAKPLKKQEPRR